MRKSKSLMLIILIITSVILRFFLVLFLFADRDAWMRIFDVILIMGIGVWIIRKTADIIEETSDILQERTKLAGGLLHSFGTAFPDMVLGVMAAITSIGADSYAKAVSFAIIAAATTFGSNIYNIGYAIWCIFRQNVANLKEKEISIFPFTGKGGSVKPIKDHSNKPELIEIDTAIDVLNFLSIITAAVAVSMVLFGQKEAPIGMKGDIYQLIRPVGLAIFILCVSIMYFFRKSKKSEEHLAAPVEENYFRDKSNMAIWLSLALSGAAILLAASGMVQAIKVFCDITKLPLIIAGVLAGIIGCLGEIIGMHNMTVHPSGKIGDAVVGVAMDNIITTMGAAIVAIMGGIFLGGNALILIFVFILTLNTVLIWQISRLKNYVLR
ncbi:MAG: hypothetical protein V1688_02305 [bacterium]